MSFLSRRRPCRRAEPACRTRPPYAVRCTTSAGPLDAVVDMLEVDDCKAALNYTFFFLRFVFFAVFFAAVFVFVLRFFAMLPS